MSDHTGKFSRRDFLAYLGAAAAFSLAAGRGIAAPAATRNFEMLVIGDSLVWGQGLEEKNKFYSLTESWIRDEVLKGSRPVNVNVKAHSGATIKLSEEESNALAKAGKSPSKQYHPEINVSFPTITKQVEQALSDYSDPGDVDLIMLSGGVPEVGVGNILNPFKSDETLRAAIQLYCFDHMSELLSLTARAFPSALIAVVGYYPIITPSTPMKRIVNDVLELYNWPRWTKPLMNNPLQRQIWRRYRRRMIKRSNIWFENSSRQLYRAVVDLNSAEGDRAVFVPSTFQRENGYGAKDTYLWKVAPKGKASDEARDQRTSECRPTLEVLREATDLKYRTRVCELASIGHPNQIGAEVIAASIRQTLDPHLQALVSNL